MITSSTRVGFIGAYKTDLMVYLAMAIAHMGQKVLVIDQSKEASLQQYIEGDDTDDVIERQGVFYTFNPVLENEAQQYDWILIDYGFEVDALKDFLQDTWCFLISDLKKSTVTKLKQQLEAIALLKKDSSNGDVNHGSRLLDPIKAPKKQSMIKVYRELLPCKIDEDYLDHQYRLDDLDILGTFKFQAHEQDLVADLLNTYNDVFEFKGYSKAWHLFIEDVVTEIVGGQDRDIKKAVRSAKQGGTK